VESAPERIEGDCGAQYFCDYQFFPLFLLRYYAGLFRIHHRYPDFYADSHMGFGAPESKGNPNDHNHLPGDNIRYLFRIS